MALAHENAAEAGRMLARARWGDTGLRRAVQTVVDRCGELDEAMRMQLRAVADGPAEDGRDQ